MKMPTPDASVLARRVEMARERLGQLARSRILGDPARILGDRRMLLADRAGRIDDPHVVGRRQVLHDPLLHEEECADEAERQQHPECRARGVDPEVAERLHLPAGDAADDGDRDRDAACSAGPPAPPRGFNG